MCFQGEVDVVLAGKVIRFDGVRGFGFIAPDGGGEDVFVHANDLLDEESLFRPGTPVEFETFQGDRGPKASSVRVVGRSSAESHASRPAPVRRSDPDEEGLCDVLSSTGFMREVTETLVEGVPTLTAAQIVQVRNCLSGVARGHGWVEL
jgi:cold shock protein